MTLQRTIEAAAADAVRAGVPADEVLVALARVLVATARGTGDWLAREGFDPDTDALVQRALELATEPELRVVE